MGAPIKSLKKIKNVISKLSGKELHYLNEDI